MAALLNSTIDTKIQVRLEAPSPALQRRLPAPWQPSPIPDGPHAGANLALIFSDVLLKQDADGQPAPDATNRYLAFLVPAVHPQTGEAATFIFRIYTAHPESVPGRYRNALPAAIFREQTLRTEGLQALCAERYELHEAAGGTVALQLEYTKARPSRVVWPTTLRSAADPSIVRLYRSEALLDVVRSLPAGVDRVRQYRLVVTVPELLDVLDGSERLVSIASIPWFIRQEFAP